MVMATLSSAEGTTKLLRSKHDSLNDIISTANALLDENLNVYLPNKELFVFELLCDRIGDLNNSSFKSWKLEKQVWVLFDRIWDILSENDDDIKMRNKISRRIRLVELLTIIMKSEISDDVLDCMFRSVRKVANEIYVEIEDGSAINLLSSFVTKSNSSENYDNWIDLIKKMFDLSHSNVGKPNKKISNRYFQECLPVIISFIVNKGDSSRTAKTLIEITSGIIFEKDFINSITSNLELLIKKTSSSMSISSMEYLFQFFVDHLSRNIKLCEEIFILITNAPKFNELSENLLAILSSKNRTLSSDFFKSIYEKEVLNKTGQNVNWKLVMYLIDLDVNLAIENSDQILSMVPMDSIGNDLALKIGSNLVNSYVISREFTEFFNKTWFSAISQNSFWKCDEFVDLVSLKIDDLSSAQLKTVLDVLYTRSDSLPQITSILEGLSHCKQEKISSVKNQILSNYKAFQGSSGYWKMMYYVLCLYGEDMILCDSQWKNAFKKNKYSKFYFDSLFRTIELTDDSTFEVQYQHEYFQYLKNNKSEVYFSLKRWILVINEFFSTEHISSYISIIFESLGLNEVSHYLTYDAEIFFEQRRIFSSFVNFLIKRIEKGDDSYIQTISLIPIQCFDKSSKKKLLDLLFSISSSGKVEVKKSLMHLLEQPSFRSRLEIDFKSLIIILNSSSVLSDKLSVSIADRVWRSHLQQYTSGESKSYVSETFKYLTTFLEEYSIDGKIRGELELTLSVLLIGKEYGFLDEEFTSNYDNLLHKFITLIDKLLHHNLNIESSSDDYSLTIWLLNSCFLVLERDSPIANETLRMVRRIGPNVSSLKNDVSANELRTKMYNLISKLSSLNIKSAIFIVSLYISLKESFDVQIEESLNDYIRDLASHDDFDSIFRYVLFSITDHDEEHINSFIPIFSSLIKALQKGKGSDSKFFLHSLSIIISSQSYLNQDSKILLLSTLKSCLGDKMWLFNQYAIETVITLVTKLASGLIYEDDNKAIDIYIQLTQVMSYIILFHRFRLTSRHHIVMITCTSLLEPLSHQEANKIISTSIQCASSYTRLIGNLCEPSNVKSKEDSQSLNTTSSLIKRSLRKHIPVLLLNYIYFNLKFNFDSKINKELVEGMYKIFDVLSELELQLINASLDVPGRSYFKTLYSNYKDHGKWKEQ